jgi:hypothetical protein
MFFDRSAMLTSAWQYFDCLGQGIGKLEHFCGNWNRLPPGWGFRHGPEM